MIERGRERSECHGGGCAWGRVRYGVDMGMPFRPTTAVALSLAALFAPVTARAQLLRRASDAVHTGSSERRRSSDDDEPRPPSQSSPTPSSSSRGRYNPWFRTRAFLPYPYAWGYQGYETPVAHVDRNPRNLAVIASLDGGLVIPSVGRGGVGLRILGSALEFELRLTAFAEPSAEQTTWAGLGRYRGAVAIVDGGGARVRLFGGLLHWIDGRGSEFGGEAGVGLDAFPGDPWVLSFDIAGGLVGRAGLVGLRGSVGYLLGPVEVQLGWQHESLIPTVSGDSVDLSGPFLGLRLWR